MGIDPAVPMQKLQTAVIKPETERSGPTARPTVHSKRRIIA